MVLFETVFSNMKISKLRGDKLCAIHSTICCAHLCFLACNDDIKLASTLDVKAEIYPFRFILLL